MKDLRQVRTARGMKQAELARRVGVTQATISILETSDLYPGEVLMAKLCRALDHDFTNHEQKQEKGEKMTQNVRVLQYMRDHGSISQRDAVQFGCYRLSARIHNLRRMGYQITTEEKAFKSEYGSGHYAVYKLIGEALT